MPPTNADRIHVLVVDDDNQLLRTLSDILSRRGYSPHIAASGREGLQIAAQAPPPAIALVDLKLPDMDGLELVARLRLLSDLTETVILTGNASLDTAVRALREQSHDYLVKPVAPEQLLVAVSRASERWRRRHVEEELRQTEERSHLLLENISDIVAVVDTKGSLTYASPSLTRRLGYDLDDVANRAGVAYLHPEDHGQLPKLQEDLRELGSTAAVELRVRHRDSSYRTLECHITNLIDRPVISGFLIVGRDVTDARRFEADLRQAQKMETVGNLAGGIAHDFNNILTAVIGYSELVLSRADLPSEVRAEVDEIRKAGERAARVTRQLLAFSRQQATTPRVLRLDSVLTDLAHMLRALVGEHVTFEIRSAPDVRPVRLDPTHLEQVVLNLVVNARDAMPEGGRLLLAAENCTLESQLEDGPPPGDYVRLTVRDSGVGMPEHVRVRALEPFFTTKEPGRGTGLGLSTCYGIVKQANGGILIESEVGFGTTVHTFWPSAADATDSAAVDTVATGVAGAGRVLVVDDDEGVRGLTAAVLRAHGYDVVLAGDAAEALRILKQPDPPIDLLLTDIVLAGMNGWQLAHDVAMTNPNLPILFMSGYDRPPVAPNTPQVGSGPLLRKPFSAATLTTTVRALLANREAH